MDNSNVTPAAVYQQNALQLRKHAIIVIFVFWRDKTPCVLHKQTYVIFVLTQYFVPPAVVFH